MIVYKKGSIFSTDKQTIVNPVNTFGVMGAGLALIFRLIFPRMYKKYREFCKKKLFKVGQLWLYNNSNYWQVLNFPTKEHYRDRSEIKWIELGLENLLKTYKDRNITSIAIPLLGCGYGDLKEEEVLPIMEKYLSQLEIPVEIWEYDPNIPNPIWEKLFLASKDEDTVFKRVVRDCTNLTELSKRPGISIDMIGTNINKLINYENTN